jgi:hypothetical protein
MRRGQPRAQKDGGADRHSIRPAVGSFGFAPVYFAPASLTRAVRRDL